MTHIITHNSKHTAHIITHTLTHKKDHNSIDTPQNNPQKRRANHFAVFVPPEVLTLVPVTPTLVKVPEMVSAASAPTWKEKV